MMPPNWNNNSNNIKPISPPSGLITLRAKVIGREDGYVRNYTLKGRFYPHLENPAVTTFLPETFTKRVEPEPAISQQQLVASIDREIERIEKGQQHYQQNPFGMSAIVREERIAASRNDPDKSYEARNNFLQFHDLKLHEYLLSKEELLQEQQQIQQQKNASVSSEEVIAEQEPTKIGYDPTIGDYYFDLSDKLDGHNSNDAVITTILDAAGIERYAQHEREIDTSKKSHRFSV